MIRESFIEFTNSYMSRISIVGVYLRFGRRFTNERPCVELAVCHG